MNTLTLRTPCHPDAPGPHAHDDRSYVLRLPLADGNEAAVEMGRPSRDALAAALEVEDMTPQAAYARGYAKGMNAGIMFGIVLSGGLLVIAHYVVTLVRHWI